MNKATVSCDTTHLSNSSILYWQYNCDRIWLTLENVNEKKKVVIDEVPVELYGYTYRLGFHLIKEYKNSLLFRGGCGATGPCSYALIDKFSGKKLRAFDQLICIDTDVQLDSPHNYNYDFIVYLAEQANDIIIYWIDNKKALKVPFKEKLTALIPQNQFEKMILDKGTLTLYYQTENKEKKKFGIHLLTTK